MPWSDALIAQTRDTLNDPLCVCDEFLHMKNFDNRFGKIHINDLLNQKWLIQDKETGSHHFYSTIDKLIADGWAID